MSTLEGENTHHIHGLHVNVCPKETEQNSELTADSGLEPTDSLSLDLPACYAADELGVKDESCSEIHPQSDLQNLAREDLENDKHSLSHSPVSLSSEVNDETYNLTTFEDYSLSKNEYSINETDHIFELKKDFDVLSTEIITNDVASTNSYLSTNSLKNTSDLDNAEMKNLTVSSVSLNEHKSNDTSSICKSPYSRSAENISNIPSEIQDNVDLKSSTKQLNTEEILSQFTNQKNKVSATQRITTENINANPDTKYVKLPKEILSQDIGSIVKNVHGIFSSVSGSLKNAYNNSHKVYIQKPVLKPMKPIPNGKVMNDIFEDEHNEITMNRNGSEDNLQSKMINEIAEEVTEADDDPRRDALRLQIEALERVLMEQRKENVTLRERVSQQAEEAQEKDRAFKNLETKMDLMCKQVEQAQREKDAAVMRYASVECAAIEARKAADAAVRAEREARNELELMNNKLKSAHSEKQRICQLYDDKCHEVSSSERELAKAREDVKELEGRLKWTQSKLRCEMDAYKDSAERAEKLSLRVSELEAGRDAAATTAADALRAKQLESELKESQAALILCRHEKSELEREASSLRRQLEMCRAQRDAADDKLAIADKQVVELKASNLRLEQEAAELAALRAQAALADTLSAQLQRESERAALAEESLARERARAETCARREAAALAHAAKLTAHHVQERSAADRARDTAQALAVDNASLRERITELEGRVRGLQTDLTEETDRRNRENKALANKVAELTQELSETNKKLEWEKGENSILKKKHASAIKELNRELQRALKRCEQLEAKLPPPDASSTRTGSVTSLSSGESTAQEDRLQNGHSDAVPDIQVREPDRQALIERIVSLQRAAARRAERCEFLEEHSKQLTGELRAKSRLLRHLLCTMPAGAVASADSDVNKKELARLGGGAMSALYGGSAEALSPELSLEINRKLQALLEDTLLKNITLKENMDTLGEEIARLKEQKSTT